MRIVGLVAASLVLVVCLVSGCSKGKEGSPTDQGQVAAKGMDTKAAMEKQNATKKAPTPPGKTR